MGWKDKYYCEHEFERGQHITYYAAPIEEDHFTELTCTKCGYKTRIQCNYVDQFLAAREPKDTTEPKAVIKPREPEPPVDVFKEIYARTPPIPDSAISYYDDAPYVDTMYATTIVEQAILNSDLITVPDYMSTYVSLYDLCEILDFIDKL